MKTTRSIPSTSNHAPASTRLHGPNRKRTETVPPLGAIAALILGLCMPASAQTLWTDGTGDWFNASNWSSGVPTSGTEARINNGGTAQVATTGAVTRTLILGNTTGQSGSVVVSGSGTLSVSGFTAYVGNTGTGSLLVANGGQIAMTGTSSKASYIAHNPGSNGQVAIEGAGSIWNSGNNLHVGFGGVGSLAIANGGRVNSAFDSDIGGTVNSTGQATVDGKGSIWNTGSSLGVADLGVGLLAITNGGQVNTTASADIGTFMGSNGQVTVDGAGSVWNSGRFANVGFGGNGSLVVTNGGQVNTGGSFSHSTIGYGETSIGHVTVNGAGSVWNTGIELYVGRSGTGSLTVTNGAKVTTTGTSYIGFNAASTGQTTLSGTGSLWNSGNYLYVGQSGAGSLAIIGGGFVTTGSDGTIATNAGSNGFVLVSDPGSLWQVGRNLYVGNSGVGAMDVLFGGRVSTGLDGFVGNNAGSTGNVTVNGPGAAWDVTRDLFIGKSGTGSLAILGGAQVTTGRNAFVGNTVSSRGDVIVDGLGSLWSVGGNLTLGPGSASAAITGGGHVTTGSDAFIGSGGQMTVGGPGSLWDVGRNLHVGNSGTGTMLVTGGGHVMTGANASSYVGYNAGSSGQVTVSGTGSLWNSGLYLHVGYGGNGSLSVTNGGQVNTIFDASVATGTSSTGQVTVAGAGSLWAVDGNLTVGELGTGTIDILNGGTVTTGVYANVGFEGSVGVAKVDASLWDITIDLYVGYSGTGTLNILNSGTVQVGRNACIGTLTDSIGTVTVTGTGSLLSVSEEFFIGLSGTGSLMITGGGRVNTVVSTIGGYDAVATGYVTVSGSGSLWSSGVALIVGAVGTGSLEITSGGQVTTDSDAFVAYNEGSTGSVKVGGPGSLWSVGGNLTVGVLGTGTIDILNGGTVTTGGSGYVDLDASVGVVNVNGPGSLWDIANDLFVGNGGTGTLNILNSGTVQAGGNGLVGASAASIGLVNVAGTGSRLAVAGDLSIGELGTGTMTVTNGAHATTGSNGLIGNQPGSTGLVIVDGGGSLWEVGADLTVGASSTGTMSITSGGQVTTGSDAFIALNDGSTGLVTINGAGSLWAVGGNLTVGVFGTGAMNILNGGAVTTGGSGFVDNGVPPTSGTSVGVVNVDASLWDVAGDLSVGNDGTGTLNILNGGTVQAGGGGFVATGGSSTGLVNVDGAGSLLTMGGALSIGQSGTGTMAITNGGRTNTPGAGSVGTNAGSRGRVMVDGTGSVWNIGTILNVGESGAGSLAVTDGGLVNTTGASGIGTHAGSSGYVTVDGAGSRWNSGFLLLVGVRGTGSLAITGGGHVTTGSDAFIGFPITGEHGSTGRVSVDGRGSFWEIGRSLTVGGGGNGTLSITRGGRALAGTDAFIGAANDSRGTVTVDGAGSRLTIGEGLFVGGDNNGPLGNGALFIQHGGAVSAASLKVWKGGVLETDASSLLDVPMLAFDGGTLRMGSGQNFHHDATLGQGGVVFDTDGFNATLSGRFSGTGGLTKTDLGRLTITSHNTYTGPTRVNAGSLFVDGSIRGNAVTGPHGMLGGLGTLYGSLANNGIVSPGHSPGMITVGGNFTQNSGGLLKIEIGGRNAGQFDLLKVGGQASLAGKLQLVRLDNFQLVRGDRIEFLTAGGGVKGAFDTVENPFSTGADPFVNGTLLTIDVVYGPKSVALEATGSFVEFASYFKLKSNQAAVAAALDATATDPRQQRLLDYLDSLPLADLPFALDLLAPEELTAMFEISFSAANMQRLNIERRLAEARVGASGFSASGLSVQDEREPMDGGKVRADGKLAVEKDILLPARENRWGVWMNGSGEFAEVDGDGNAPGFDFDTAGVTLGIDNRVSDELIAGAFLGYAHTWTQLALDGRIGIDGAKAGVYATLHKGGAYLDAVAGFGYNFYDTKRRALDGLARGRTEGVECFTALSGGYDVKLGAVTFGPVASLQYSYAQTQGFTERRSLAPLRIDGHDQDSLRSNIGLRAAVEGDVIGAHVTLEVRGTWQHEYLDDIHAIGARFFEGDDALFTVQGPELGRDAALVGAGVNVQWTPSFATFGYYDGQLGRDNFESHSVVAGVRIGF